MSQNEIHIRAKTPTRRQTPPCRALGRKGLENMTKAAAIQTKKPEPPPIRNVATANGFDNRVSPVQVLPEALNTPTVFKHKQTGMRIVLLDQDMYFARVADAALWECAQKHDTPDIEMGYAVLVMPLKTLATHWVPEN